MNVAYSRICMVAMFFDMSRVVFNNFLHIDAADRSKIRIDQKRLFFFVTLSPFHFSRTLPFNVHLVCSYFDPWKGLNSVPTFTERKEHVILYHLNSCVYSLELLECTQYTRNIIFKQLRLLIGTPGVYTVH